jgi:tripartite-type tricarboxylate transporter receptor subunit TctC
MQKIIHSQHRPWRWLAALLIACSVSALAQKFPTHAVTIVNPYPAGGGADNIARMLANHLSQEWGQAVIVENRPGAGTTIAAAYVAKAKPDGYTLLLSSTQHAIAPLLFKKLPYDYLTHLSAVATLSFSPFVLITPMESEFRTLDQLVMGLKQKGDKINFGSSGLGGLPHLSGVRLNQVTGAQARHIPYAGTTPAVNAILNGSTDFLFADNSIIPLIQSGKVRALAVTSDKRTESLMQTPTMAETFAGFTATVWTGLEAPAGTPRPVIDQIHASVLKVLKEPALVKFYKDSAREMKILNPDEFSQFKESEVKTYEKLVQDAKLNLIEN